MWTCLITSETCNVQKTKCIYKRLCFSTYLLVFNFLKNIFIGVTICLIFNKGGQNYWAKLLPPKTSRLVKMRSRHIIFVHGSLFCEFPLLSHESLQLCKLPLWLCSLKAVISFLFCLNLIMGLQLTRNHWGLWSGFSDQSLVAHVIICMNINLASYLPSLCKPSDALYCCEWKRH